MSTLATIDHASLAHVTGGGNKGQQPQPQYPNCVAFCGNNTVKPTVKATGIKTGPIHYSSTDNSTANNSGFASGAKVELGNPLPIGEVT